MKFSNEEILRFIVASKILEQYLEQSPSLRDMISDSKNSNIHFGKESGPDIYAKEVMERRIKIQQMEGVDELSKANAHALESVKTFIEKYPENNILSVTFNCSAEHFSVWCGLLANHIKVLCVMKGGNRIPDYAFEKQGK